MPKGLRIPFQASATGGISTIEGDENDRQVISAYLSDGDNENAFQQNITLGIDMIFDISDPLMRSRVFTRIVRLFEFLESKKRFKLLTETIQWDETDIANGNMILSFRYLNLESDQPQTYEQKFSSGV